MVIRNGKFRNTRLHYGAEEHDNFYRQYDECLENGEISSEEAGFMQGYDNPEY